MGVDLFVCKGAFIVTLLTLVVKAQEETAPSVDDSLPEMAELSDKDFLDRFDELGKTIACEAMSNFTEPSALTLNLDRSMSLADVTRLTFLHKGRNLSKTLLPFPEDIAWKRVIVNNIFNIFMLSCPNKFVRHGYMNIMRELIMIYLNSVEPRGTEYADVWASIATTLKSCGNDPTRTPYMFTSSGLRIEGVYLMTNDSVVKDALGLNGGSDDADDNSATGIGPPPRFPQDEGGWVAPKPDPDSDEADDEKTKPAEPPAGVRVPLELQIESADALPLDLIIENFWMVFSHAWANCLPGVDSTDLWGPRFKQLFFKDFLAPLEDRWKSFGTLEWELSVIVGDFDVKMMQYNIPFCTEAAYAVGGLEELQLIRPIKLADISDGVAAFQNKKLS